jgi:8-oxo-dGTP diphosphatase
MDGFMVAVDLVVLTIRSGALQVLLVRRTEPPYRGRWALPGAFVRPEEDLPVAAARVLTRQTAAGHLEQLGSYGGPKRDPRGRVVTVAYLALLPDLSTSPESKAPRGPETLRVPQTPGDSETARASQRPRATETPAEGVWHDVVTVARLAFDHAGILADGVERARAKLEYTSLAAAFCPPEFTVAQLREVYEAVWGAPLDPRNFHRKVTSTEGFVTPIGASTGGTRGRPAQLFRRGPADTLHPPLLRPAVGVASGA